MLPHGPPPRSRHGHLRLQTLLPANTCSDPCDKGGLNILGRLRGIFQKGDRGCHGGCNTACVGNACGSTVVAPVVPGGEKIDITPKKMPDIKKAPEKIAPPKAQEVRVEPAIPPIVTPPGTIPSVQVSPTIEVTPAPAPRVEGDRRDPF